jgi:hypothetical protein
MTRQTLIAARNSSARAFIVDRNPATYLARGEAY